jgi:hypothetical protein
MSEWISCARELPPNCVDVLVWFDDESGGGYYAIGQYYYLGPGWCCRSLEEGEPSHWMPLPGRPGDHVQGEPS